MEFLSYGAVCQDFLAKCCVCKTDTVTRPFVWIFKTCPTPYTGFPHGSGGKESACGAGDPGWILGGDDPLEKETATHSSILA